MHPADILKMAITTMFDAFEYLRMPFGLMNSGAKFQRKVDRAVADLEVVFAYVDNMDVASKNAEEHAIHLWQLFTGLREHGLVINAEKCVFGASSIEFLGHRLSAAWVEPLPAHVAAVVDFPRPSTVKELQGFLGMVNFYRRFLPGAAKLLKPLTDCLRGVPKGTTIISWEASMEKSFESAKQLLASAARLAYPVDAYLLDASATHVGACLQQQRPGRAGWKPLFFFQKSWSRLRSNILHLTESSWRASWGSAISRPQAPDHRHQLLFRPLDGQAVTAARLRGRV